MHNQTSLMHSFSFRCCWNLDCPIQVCLLLENGAIVGLQALGVDEDQAEVHVGEFSLSRVSWSSSRTERSFSSEQSNPKMAQALFFKGPQHATTWIEFSIVPAGMVQRTSQYTKIA
ncbi:hypothetical protein PTI98_002828 [Pleurotus ostreatus]|nr:hypothetical protein PTI98_002817 [Pleurotus ostreatus]KAJ8699737.1 hypothetical protein PTI98_002828 [Pleurotus ostreatus]